MHLCCKKLNSSKICFNIILCNFCFNTRLKCIRRKSCWRSEILISSKSPNWIQIAGLKLNALKYTLLPCCSIALFKATLKFSFTICSIYSCFVAFHCSSQDEKAWLDAINLGIGWQLKLCEPNNWVNFNRFCFNCLSPKSWLSSSQIKGLLTKIGSVSFLLMVFSLNFHLFHLNHSWHTLIMFNNSCHLWQRVAIIQRLNVWCFYDVVLKSASKLY